VIRRYKSLSGNISGRLVLMDNLRAGEILSRGGERSNSPRDRENYLGRQSVDPCWPTRDDRMKYNCTQPQIIAKFTGHWDLITVGNSPPH
jgi:hypothetical protein